MITPQQVIRRLDEYTWTRDTDRPVELKYS